MRSTPDAAQDLECGMQMRMSAGKVVVGIDVGGCAKGYHAVALRNGKFEPHHFMKAADVARWCLEHCAQCVAIDAPCGWAVSGGSRLAERSLAVGGDTIQCFKTPSRAAAEGNAFYDWVFSGEKLYRSLASDYGMFDGDYRSGKVMFETFPHAVVCSLAGQVVSARMKGATRRRVLRDQGFDDSPLANIDFVDAALCALTAERFLHGSIHAFGNVAEGYIVIPNNEAS
jgi:predicted RNase H-like nuclease